MQNLKDMMKKGFYNVLEAVFISASIVALIFWLVGQPVEIIGDSMYPTYKNGEKIIANKITYKLETPQRGDVVIFRHPDNKRALAIKRVVGIPFDHFMIKEGKVYINDEPFDEEYLANSETKGKEKIPDELELLVPEDSYVLLGDNREESRDSRYWGYIKEEDIIGKPFMVYLPYSNFRIVQ